MTVSTPKISVRGIRAALPSGVVLGRVSKGVGATEVIPLSAIAQSLALQPSIAPAKTTLTGLDANKPASPGGASLYFATDTGKLYGWNGTSWVAVGGGSGGGAPWWFTPPHVSDFPTAIGTHPLIVADDPDVGLTATPSALVTGDYTSAVLKALPAGDFQVSARIAVTGVLQQYAGGGLVLYDSVGANKVIHWKIGINLSLQLEVQNYNFPSGYSADVTVATATSPTAWLRIARAGTTLSYYYSSDGKAWVLFTSASQTAWLANPPNYIGPFLWLNRTSPPYAMSVGHWDQSW